MFVPLYQVLLLQFKVCLLNSVVLIHDLPLAAANEYLSCNYLMPARTVTSHTAPMGQCICGNIHCTVSRCNEPPPVIETPTTIQQIMLITETI